MFRTVRPLHKRIRTTPAGSRASMTTDPTETKALTMGPAIRSMKAANKGRPETRGNRAKVVAGVAVVVVGAGVVVAGANRASRLVSHKAPALHRDSSRGTSKGVLAPRSHRFSNRVNNMDHARVAATKAAIRGATAADRAIAMIADPAMDSLAMRVAAIAPRRLRLKRLAVNCRHLRHPHQAARPMAVRARRATVRPSPVCSMLRDVAS